jgi:hypothetical protein
MKEHGTDDKEDFLLNNEFGWKSIKFLRGDVVLGSKRIIMTT